MRRAQVRGFNIAAGWVAEGGRCNLPAWAWVVVLILVLVGAVVAMDLLHVRPVCVALTGC